MIALSEFTIISILEAFSVLLLGLFALVFYNGRLRSRIDTLNGWLSQLKRTTSQLIQDANKAGKALYSDFLAREINESKAHFNELEGSEIDNLAASQAPDSRATAIRHMFLTSEMEAESATSDSEKWEKITHGMQELVHAIEDNHSDSDNQTDLTSLKENWGTLCDSAIVFIGENSAENEVSFIEAMQEVNADLGREPLTITPCVRENRLVDVRPDVIHKSGKVKAIDMSASQAELSRHKDAASQQKRLIEALLKQKADAETQISIKSSELTQLQRYHQESEVCIELLEEELRVVHAELEALMSKTGINTDLEALVAQHSQEMAELLTCIETLEKENEQLRKDSGSV